MDCEAILRDRAQGMSLSDLARKHQVSKASICKLLDEASKRGCHKPLPQPPPQTDDSTYPDSTVSPV